MRKKVILSVCLAGLLCCFSFSGMAKDKAKTGLVASPGFWGPAIGLRSWLTPVFGVEGRVGLNWGFSDYDIKGKVMYAFKTTTIRWYGVGALGRMTMSGDISVFGMTSTWEGSTTTIAIGIGGEKLYGIQKNHGLSLEVGYQMGKIKYDFKTTYKDFWGNTQTTTTKGEYSSPIYLAAGYAFYF